MASSNFTTHYSIPLPLGTDLTTPMDYNEAAEAVDTALFGAVTDAGNASAAAAEAVNTANTASGVAEDVRADLALEKAKIIQLQTRMTAAENDIDDVYTDVTDMITAYKESSATSTHAYAIGDYFIYNETLYKATAAIAIGATIVPNTNCETTNVSSELIQINSDLNKYHRRVAYYMNTTNKTYAQCLTEICDQLDALQLDDEQVANLCLEAGLESSSFNLFRCVRHNKANGYYCFVGFTAGATVAMIYNGHTTASGATTTVVEHTLADGTENDISSATNSTEWRVYV